MAPAPEDERSAPPRPARPDSQRGKPGEQRAPPAARSVSSDRQPAPSGIVVDQASQEKVIPASVRADGSERRVKPGFTPAEDVLRFRSPRMMARKREEAAKERVAGTPTKAAAAPSEQRKPTAATGTGAKRTEDPVALVQERMAALSVRKDESPAAKGEEKDAPVKPASRADERTEKAGEPTGSDAETHMRRGSSERTEPRSNTAGSKPT